MLELEEALERILRGVQAATPEQVAVSNAHGRILAETLSSPSDLPPFDNSAMDGYAIRSDDVPNATTDKPVRLRVLGTVAAGNVYGGEVTPGTCVRIFTGSPLPAGADCVVMQEDTAPDEQEPGSVKILEVGRPWENVRLKGEDVRAGEAIIPAGCALRAGHLCLLSAVGISAVNVGRRPRVALVATGTELREPGEPLKPGEIYESNRVGLSVLIRSAGGEPALFPIVHDDAGATRQALSEAVSTSDIVVSVGGASVGQFDLVKPAVSDLGGQIEFWRVAIRPGRPFVFGRLNQKLFFGLPGNPVSAMVTFLVLVRPALRKWQGASDTGLEEVPGTLGEDLHNPGARRQFARVKMDANGLVRTAGAQGSHVLKSFAEARGLVDIPAGSVLKSGTPVKVKLWA